MAVLGRPGRRGGKPCRAPAAATVSRSRRGTPRCSASRSAPRQAQQGGLAGGAYEATLRPARQSRPGECQCQRSDRCCLHRTCCRRQRRRRHRWSQGQSPTRHSPRRLPRPHPPRRRSCWPCPPPPPLTTGSSQTHSPRDPRPHPPRPPATRPLAGCLPHQAQSPSAEHHGSSRLRRRRDHAPLLRLCRRPPPRSQRPLQRPKLAPLLSMRETCPGEPAALPRRVTPAPSAAATAPCCGSEPSRCPSFAAGAPAATPAAPSVAGLALRPRPRSRHSSRGQSPALRPRQTRPAAPSSRAACVSS